MPPLKEKTLSNQQKSYFDVIFLKKLTLVQKSYNEENIKIVNY